jgi:hypothetical protein
MNKSVTLLLTFAIALTLNGCDNKKSKSSDTTNISNITCTGGGVVKYGYQLPPCPDPIENDKTLLGIDSNKNGVRDDVEIWIYHTYDTHKNCVKTEEIREEIIEGHNFTYGVIHENCTDEDIPYHQIVREIAMQRARAYQIVIQEPEKARETYPILDAAQYCEFYFLDDAKYNNEPILINDYDLYKELRYIQFDTVQRARAYHEYNFYLGGGAYPLETNTNKRRAFCDFDVDKLLGK